MPRHKSSIDFEEYFTGPMNPVAFSNIPYFLRLRGSVLPNLILPLLCVGGWATLITCISKLVWSLGVNNVLITALGFVVGLALSIRSTTAYERYIEGRKYWAQIVLTVRNLARILWVHVAEREGEEGKDDILGKLTCMNMLIGFVTATKHRLRFEPGYDYPDLRPYVQNLSTFAKSAYETDGPTPVKQYSGLRRAGQWLGIPGTDIDPTKAIRKGAKYHGNLPLEILTYVSSYMNVCISNGSMPVVIMQMQVMTSLASLLECLTGMERILGTPIPLAYNIVISQIAWVYVLILPFQLVNLMGWVTIPATIAAAYIILAIEAIGNELEDPFGTDVNDLDMDDYIRNLTTDLDIMTSMAPPKAEDFIKTDNNTPFGPTFNVPYSVAKAMSVDEIRSYLRKRGCSQKMTAKDPVNETEVDAKLNERGNSGVNVEVV